MAERIGRTQLRRLELEEYCRDLANRYVIPHLLPGAGFAFLMFDFGDVGNIAYLSNAKRGDMVKVLEELIGKLKAN